MLFNFDKSNFNHNSTSYTLSVPCCAVSCRVVLVLCCAVLRRVVLCCVGVGVVLCCAVLYCIVLCCPLLHCIVLSCTVLCCVVSF